MDSVTEAGGMPQSIVRGLSAGKATIMAGILTGVLCLDIFTKSLVQRNMLVYEQRDIIGEYVRLTYIFNTGAAFGIQLGPYSREIFLVLSLVALIALALMFYYTPVEDKLRLASISLICAGAIGNLIDRVRSENGVVDFLDVGIGTMRWPVFNVADMAVTAGAIVLALSLWKEEQRDGG
ncbi:MAG TPA: signal peptidase II [Longimicrobiales bacterium]